MLKPVAVAALLALATTACANGTIQATDDDNSTDNAEAGAPSSDQPFDPAAAPLPTTDGGQPPPSEPPPAPSKGESKGALVAYWASWTRAVLPVSEIPWSKITHVAHSFVLPASGGGLRDVSSYVDAGLIGSAHARSVKVIASVGGWGANFDMNVDPAMRAKTVNAMAALCRTHGYDGIDLDWEYPTDKTAAAWAAMVSELRSALDAIDPALTISAAVSAAPETLSVLPTAALEKLSWIGVMTYDYAGPWSSSIAHGAPLHASRPGEANVAHSIAYLTNSRGITRGKVLVGLPFYGYEFGGNALGAGPVAPSKGLDYRELAGRIGQNGWTKRVDEKAAVPYLTRTGSPGFTSYDDATSITAKCAYAKSNALGGAIIWHLAGDRMGDGSQPLLDAAQLCR